MPVTRLGTHGGDVGDKLTALITEMEAQGKEIVNMVCLFDEWLIVWRKAKRETR